MSDELYRSREECKVPSKQRYLYYTHTASNRGVVEPSTTHISKAPRPARNYLTPLRNALRQGDSLQGDIAPILKNPPSSSWDLSNERFAVAEVKEEYAQRSREVTRVSFDEAARISGRDQRGFRHGEEEGWTDETKKTEAKRVWECCVM